MDKDSGLVHTLTTTAANVSDISQTAALLHGQEHDVWADAGYVGVDRREDMQQALAANEQTVQWHVAKRRKTIEKLDDGWQKDLAQAYEKLKARVRAYVEHPFHVVKNICRHRLNIGSVFGRRQQLVTVALVNGCRKARFSGF